MLAWISENLATILIALGLTAILAAVIAVLIRDKKRGKSSCGGNCAHCPMGGCSHQNAKPPEAQSTSGGGKNNSGTAQGSELPPKREEKI